MSLIKSLVRNQRFVNGLLYHAVFLGMVVRFRNVWLHNPIESLWSDPGRHWNTAVNALETNIMSFVDPIFYQICLGAVARVTMGDPGAIAVYAGVLSILGPTFWYLFLREVLPLRQALIGWAVLMWLPSWITIYSYFMNETLLLPLIGLSLFLTYRAKRENTVSAFLLCAGAWLLAALTRVVALPMGSIAVATLLWSQPQKIKKTLLLAAMLAVVLIPITYRSYTAMGVFAPFGYQKLARIHFACDKKSIEFDVSRAGESPGHYGFTAPALVAEIFEPFSDWKSSRSGVFAFKLDFANGSQDWDRVLDECEMSSRRYLELWAENIVFFLFSRSFPDGSEHRWEQAATHTRWIWAPLLLIVSILNGGILRREKSLPLFVVMGMLTWILCLTFPVVILEGRYRKPLEGFLIANVLWLYSKMRTKN